MRCITFTVKGVIKVVVWQKVSFSLSCTESSYSAGVFFNSLFLPQALLWSSVADVVQRVRRLKTHQAALLRLCNLIE